MVHAPVYEDRGSFRDRIAFLSALMRNEGAETWHILDRFGIDAARAKRWRRDARSRKVNKSAIEMEHREFAWRFALGQSIHEVSLRFNEPLYVVAYHHRLWGQREPGKRDYSGRPVSRAQERYLRLCRAYVDFERDRRNRPPKRIDKKTTRQVLREMSGAIEREESAKRARQDAERREVEERMRRREEWLAAVDRERNEAHQRREAETQRQAEERERLRESLREWRAEKPYWDDQAADIRRLSERYAALLAVYRLHCEEPAADHRRIARRLRARWEPTQERLETARAMVVADGLIGDGVVLRDVRSRTGLPSGIVRWLYRLQCRDAECPTVIHADTAEDAITIGSELGLSTVEIAEACQRSRHTIKRIRQRMQINCE